MMIFNGISWFSIGLRMAISTTTARDRRCGIRITSEQHHTGTELQNLRLTFNVHAIVSRYYECSNYPHPKEKNT